MGKFSPICDTISILFLAIVLSFSFFPLSRQVNAQSMNWSIVIFSGVVIVSLTYYFLHARKVYKGPITKVRMLS